jgi:hypothetical protein
MNMMYLIKKSLRNMNGIKIFHYSLKDLDSIKMKNLIFIFMIESKKLFFFFKGLINNIFLFFHIY